MSIGQLVAISYASGLYYATCEIAPPKRLVVRSSRLLTFTTLTATVSAYFLEQNLSTGYFLPLLLVIHLLILLPLFESQHPLSETSISLKQLHLLDACLGTHTTLEKYCLHGQYRNLELDSEGNWRTSCNELDRLGYCVLCYY